MPNKNQESIIVKLDKWSLEVTGNKWTVRIALVLVFILGMFFIWIKHSKKESDNINQLFDCNNLKSQETQLNSIEMEIGLNIDKIDNQLPNKSLPERRIMLENRRKLQARKDSINSIFIPMLKNATQSCPDSNSKNTFENIQTQIGKLKSNN
jgi:hypothetical protein